MSWWNGINYSGDYGDPARYTVCDVCVKLVSDEHAVTLSWVPQQAECENEDGSKAMIVSLYPPPLHGFCHDAEFEADRKEFP